MRQLLVVLPILLAWTTVAAQQPQAPESPAPSSESREPSPEQDPTFRTGIDVIAVDVAVVDRNGRPVEDLRAPEFSVKIDGETRRVVSAELVKMSADEARAEADAPTETFYTSNLTPPKGRMVVLAVDQTNIHPASIKPLMNAASQFLDRLSPLDQVSFMTFPEPGPRVGFTTDRLKVRLAMETLVGRTMPLPGASLNVGTVEALAIDRDRDQQVLDEVVARECGRQAVAQCTDLILTHASQIAARVRQNALESLDGLRQLLLRLAALDGHKSLILISEGLAVDELAELPSIVALAGRARTSINVMLVDLSRDDVTIDSPSPTGGADRRLQMSGLEGLAVMSRGALFRVAGTGEPIFDRLASEISAYYLLGVEQQPGDEESDRRRIDVEVRRRDVTIRSRQAFVLSPAATARRGDPDETLRDALLSPFGVSGVPVRATTFVQQDPASDEVQVMVAADVGAPGAGPSEYTVGYVLVDDRNVVAASFLDTLTLAPLAGSPTETVSFLGHATVDPGVYTLRFGVVDADGRSGSIVRDVSAWKLAGQEFAAGDLIVGNVPAPGEGLRASVEPHVTADTLALYLELYSTDSAAWEGTSVAFEIADGEQAPALATATGGMAPGRQPAWRAASGVLGTGVLPPGRYVARAQITRGGRTIGALARPFVLERAAGAPAIAPAAVAAAAVSFGGSLPPFDRSAALSDDLVGEMLDLVEQRSPALTAVVSEARAGRYGPAALEALSEGDQTTAAFLRGLDFFAKGQLQEAVTQLDIASGPAREFFPAAFYLGAVFAAAGQDREAAGIWQLALGTEARPAAVYPLIADARLRDGQPASAIEVLQPAYDRNPSNDDIARRLGMAYVMTGRHAEAVPVLDAYLTRHGTDEDMLLAAIIAQYEVARAGQSLSNVDRAKLLGYAKAYRGEHRALVDKYLETLQVR